jgi:hypothetical protein
MKPYINLSISIAIIWKDFCPMKKKNPQLTDASNEERIFLIRKLEGRKEFCMVGVVISEGNSSTRRKILDTRERKESSGRSGKRRIWAAAPLNVLPSALINIPVS